MLPEKNRLPLSSELERVKGQGQVFQGKFFGLIVAPGKETPRFGFIISTKVAKKASQRNRAKRILREAVRGNLGLLPRAVDGVFLAKKKIIGRPFFEVEKEVTGLFEKVKQWQK